MRRILSTDQRGLTLIEFMVGAFLVAIVLFAAGSVYVSTEQSFKTGSKKLLAQQEATLLAKGLNRNVRIGSGYRVYNVPNESVPADSGNGLAVLDASGTDIYRVEWDNTLETLVDSLGNRVTAMRLQDVMFKRDSTDPQTVRYRFKTNDEAGNLVDIESAVSVRN